MIAKILEKTETARSVSPTLSVVVELVGLEGRTVPLAASQEESAVEVKRARYPRDESTTEEQYVLHCGVERKSYWTARKRHRPTDGCEPE